MNTKFRCGCNNGKTEVLAVDLVRHTCGFRPSQSYGWEGVPHTFRRMQVNPKLTGGYTRYNWFVEYQH